MGSWKITIIGGSSNGSVFSLRDDAVILVGRSHSADVRIPEKDVSGRHMELKTIDGVPSLVSLTRNSVTTLNGVEASSGIAYPVSAGDAIALGGKVQMRLDEVPSSIPEANEYETSTPGATQATRWMTESVFSRDTPTASILEESALSGTGATRFGNIEETVAVGSTNLAPDAETIASTGGAFVSSEDTTGCGEGDEGCKTVAAQTQAAPMEVIEQLRGELDRKSRRRKVGLMSALFMFAVFLIGLWFATRPDGEADVMEFPRGEDGRPDVAFHWLKDEQGRPLIKLDYPRNPKATVTTSPDSAGISVVSFMGRDRDVPFFLQLEALSSQDELRRDLLASVRSWVANMESSGLGLVFDEKEKDAMRQEFFEDAYPKSCQEKSLYGVRFVRFEYKRTWPDGNLWHGIVIYFRRGDTAYVLRREIPELYWVRGRFRMSYDPNIAIYGNYTESYWESAGDTGLPSGTSVADLMSEIRSSLSKDRASDWRSVRKCFDVVLANTWRTDPKTRDLAMGCLRQFREKLRVFYWEKFNAFQNAKDNNNNKLMLKFRKDAEFVFDDKDERYYFLIGNGEVW